MNIIINLLVTAVAVVITAYLLTGVTVASFGAAFLVAVVLALLNTFLKPILVFLTLPINVVTIGLFTLVINAAIVMLASELVPGFKVNGFLWALAFSIILTIINGLLYRFLPI